MRILAKIIVCIASVLAAGLAQAQAIYATVSATVTDPSGHPLAGGQYSIVLKDPTGRIITSAKTPNGSIVTTTPPPGILDTTGHFSISLLQTNTLTSPIGTTWTFTIAPPPLNTQSFILTFQPPWVINYTTAITGNMDLSTQLSSLASPIQFINLATGQNTLTSNGLTGSGTNGYLAQWNSGTGIGNSSLNFNVTNPGYLTSSAPVAITPLGGGNGGFVYASPTTGLLSSTNSLPLQCAGFTCAAYNQNNPAFPANWYPLLTAPITASSLSIPVGSTVGVGFPGCVFSDLEFFCYDTITSSTLELSNINRRGLNGTAAAGHTTVSRVVGAIQTIAACASCPQTFAVTTAMSAIGSQVSTGSTSGGLQTNGIYDTGRINATQSIATSTEAFIGSDAVIGATLGDSVAPCHFAGCLNFTTGSSAAIPTVGYAYFHPSSTAMLLSVNGGAESSLCTAANITTICPSGAGYITSLTTLGTSGAASVSSGVLNVPVYTPPAGGFIAANPAGSQTITQPGGTSLSTIESQTGATSGSLLNPSMNCSGTGYNLGNNGTAAQGWGGCGLFGVTLASAVRGIDQLFGGKLTHNGQGDTAWMYGYLRAFGGVVASSDEAVTYQTNQVAQVGYTKGTLGNGSVGYSGGGSSPLANGVVYLSPQATLLESGNIQTITIAYAGTATAGQVVDAVLATNNGANSYTTTNIIPLTLAAGVGPQTFTSGTGFTPVTGAAGQLAGAYTASGVQLAGTSITQIALAGAPSLGTATYTTGGGNGLSINVTMASPATGSTSLATNGVTCNYGQCLALAQIAFADGGILLDTTQVGSTATLVSNGSTLGTSSFALSAPTASVPVSLAWGNIIAASCTPNGNGQYQTYTSTTCNVTLGTSPATPANFVAGTDICLSGPFQEESAVTAVGTAAGGVQSVTFSTRYAWNSPTINTTVMQGPPCGKAMVDSNHLTDWPIAYAVVGATSTTNVLWSNCRTGACNNGNDSTIYPSNVPTQNNTISAGLTMVRASNVVTLTGISGLDSFAVGSTIVITGASPSDLNGTFTVATNSLDTFNSSMTWAQTGVNESATGTFTISGAPFNVTFFPMAFLTGSGGSNGQAFTVGTNRVPFTLGDVVVGAPTSEYQQTGLNIYLNQTSPSNGGLASGGIFIDDGGPAIATNDIFVQNSGIGTNMLSAQGGWINYFNFGKRPAYNGSLIYVGGGEPVSANAKPYFIFQDGQNSSSKFQFDPLHSTFSLGGLLTDFPGFSGSKLQLTNAPTTLNMTSVGGVFTGSCPGGNVQYGFATADGQYGQTAGPGLVYCNGTTWQTLLGGPNVATPLAAGSTIGGKLACLADGTNCLSNSENAVTSATTALSPTSTLNTVTLAANYSFTLAAGGAGTQTCLVFVQGAAAVYTVTAPANVVGLFSPAGTAFGKRNVQCFTYSPSLSLWVATSPGVINE